MKSSALLKAFQSWKRFPCIPACTRCVIYSSFPYPEWAEIYLYLRILGIKFCLCQLQIDFPNSTSLFFVSIVGFIWNNEGWSVIVCKRLFAISVVFLRGFSKLGISYGFMLKWKWPISWRCEIIKVFMPLNYFEMVRLEELCHLSLVVSISHLAGWTKGTRSCVSSETCVTYPSSCRCLGTLRAWGHSWLLSTCGKFCVWRHPVKKTRRKVVKFGLCSLCCGFQRAVWSKDDFH